VRIHHAEDFRTARARSAFRDWRGVEAEPARAAEIEALPVVTWKGRRLRTLRCHGTSGRGPHDVNVPESLPWTLIDVGRFLCPFHANDRAAWQAWREGQR
jgi:hypothetical protein